MTRIEIDIGRYTKTLDKTMQIQIRQAARAWLRAVILKVPVWTGTSRGSLKPLGSFLRVAVPILPVVSRKGMGPGIGAQLSAFSFGKYGTKYVFEFDENVIHYYINEFYNVNPPIHLITPGPYLSFVAGAEAFQEYITNELPKRLPRAEEAIISTEIKIAGY